MAAIKLKYVNSFYDRHGKLRHLVRVPGQKSKTLPGSPGGEEFMAAYHAALAMVPPEIGAGQTKAGTFNALIVSYYKADAFTKALSPVTQRARRNILERFRDDHGNRKVTHLLPHHVAKILEDK